MSKKLPVALSVAAVIVAVLATSPWASGTQDRAAAAPKVLGYSSHELGPVRFTPTRETVGSLTLPRGKFIVNATVTVTALSGPADAYCELVGGGALASAQAEQLRTDGAGIATLALTSSANLGSAGSIGVSCRLTGGGGSADATAISITAIKVTRLSATAVG